MKSFAPLFAAAITGIIALAAVTGALALVVLVVIF